jgi:AcrR family transcriptional regulator
MRIGEEVGGREYARPTMARATQTATGGGTRRRASVRSPKRRAPSPQRATAEDAIELATATHLAGERVDMGVLAQQLAIGRATLYRWFGSRERLLEEVLLRRMSVFIALAREQARGSGDERLMQIIGAMVGASTEARPVRSLIEREPTLALRILAGEHGRLHRLMVEETMRDLASTRSESQLKAMRDRVDATIQVITALLWVAIAIGDEPPVARIEGLARELLAEHPARKRR